MVYAAGGFIFIWDNIYLVLIYYILHVTFEYGSKGIAGITLLICVRHKNSYTLAWIWLRWISLWINFLEEVCKLVPVKVEPFAHRNFSYRFRNGRCRTTGVVPRLIIYGFGLQCHLNGLCSNGELINTWNNDEVKVCVVAPYSKCGWVIPWR